VLNIAPIVVRTFRTLRPVSAFVISTDDPRVADVYALLERHLAFCRATSPAEDVHALDLEGLLDPAVTFFSVRRDDDLFAIGALKEIDADHGELKSMHTAAEGRGQGAGRALLDHLLAVARRRGYRRVSLETGTMDAFGPARALYRMAGFSDCEPFGGYRASPNSACMTLSLEGAH
jgi:putative acetyltransferase